MKKLIIVALISFISVVWITLSDFEFGKRWFKRMDSMKTAI
jgi:hypothetical protein